MIASVEGIREADRTRGRLLWTLVGTVGLGSTGNIAAVAVGTIAAAELSGSTALSGVPGATVVLGSAAGSYLLSAVMVRRGRRAGLALGLPAGRDRRACRRRGDGRALAAGAAHGHDPDRLRVVVEPAVALRGGRHVPG